jgi:hypothetical protein
LDFDLRIVRDTPRSARGRRAKEATMKKTQVAINYMQLFEEGFDLFDIAPFEGTNFANVDDAEDPIESRSIQRVKKIAF